MKTIQISDESYEFLKSLVHEMKTQDRRCTADPYFYIIHDKKETTVPDGYGDFKRYYLDDGLMTELEVLEDYGNEGMYDIETILEKYPDITEFDCIEETVEKIEFGIFLTEKACEECIERNKHRFNKPYSYVEYAYRNPELRQLFEVIKEIGKE